MHACMPIIHHVFMYGADQPTYRSTRSLASIKHRLLALATKYDTRISNEAYETANALVCAGLFSKRDVTFAGDNACVKC